MGPAGTNTDNFENTEYDIDHARTSRAGISGTEPAEAALVAATRDAAALGARQTSPDQAAMDCTAWPLTNRAEIGRSSLSVTVVRNAHCGMIMLAPIRAMLATISWGYV